MRCPQKGRLVALICGIGLLTLQSPPLQAQKAKAPARAASVQAGAAPSRVWKSETTGKEYRVRVDQERFYAEWINIPAEQVKHKVYIRSEALRSGSKWVGASRSFLPCAEGKESSSKAASTAGSKGDILNWCHFVTRIEIQSVTADKITGHGDSLRNFDCHTCKVLETGWGEFVWVPKR